jgi:ABC-type metal ion transport system substrate-binding protein
LRFGIDRNAKYRALRLLEDAGLIAIKRKLGQSPLVTIYDRSPAR